MLNISYTLAPGKRLSIALVVGLLVVGYMVWLAQSRPWLGLNLAWDYDAGTAMVVSSKGPGAVLPAGTKITRISASGLSHKFVADDFVAEPDGNLRTYKQYYQFLKNQDILASIQDQPKLTLTSLEGLNFNIAPDSTTPLSQLPIDFWIQIAVGFLAWFIVSAVWAFQPGNIAAFYLLLNGATTLSFSPAAAVYTTRELAIPLAELGLLKLMNFGGGLMFCATLIALLLNYPARLFRWWLGPAVILAYAIWFVAQDLGVFDSMMIARRLPVFIALIAICILSITQWLKTSKDPISRASLRWFLLSWFIGFSLFVMLIMVPQIIEADTGSLQGYSFLLILLVYLGIALGIMRYRLFDLGIWWFRAIAWISGAFLLIFLDLVFLFGMQFSAGISLSLSLLVCALLWLPFRNWLWHKILFRQPKSDNLFKSVMQVALAINDNERTKQWLALLRALFEPLQIDNTNMAVAVCIKDDGLTLVLPAAAGSAALELRYPSRGRRLFNAVDLDLAKQISNMLAFAETSREAYAQGAIEERNRIAQDLHDDLGAILLHGMNQTNLDRARESMERAVSEMRVILQGLSGERQSLDTVLEDLRYEISGYLEVSGKNLQWQYSNPENIVSFLDYKSVKNLCSVIREIIINIIRHSLAENIYIYIDHNNQSLDLIIKDDGQTFNLDLAASGGYGLANINKRINDIGGTIEKGNQSAVNIINISIPLTKKHIY